MGQGIHGYQVAIKAKGQKMKREKALYFVLRKCGIQDGCLLPWWARILMIAVIPDVAIPAILSGRYYDWQRDCFIVDGIRLSRHAFRLTLREPYPSQWFRFISKENGTVTVETMPKIYDLTEGVNAEEVTIVQWAMVSRKLLDQVSEGGKAAEDAEKIIAEAFGFEAVRSTRRIAEKMKQKGAE